MRGEARALRKRATRGRITPACAGRSFGHSQKCEKWEDHPRVCGEKSGVSLVVRAKTGSPPRVRGEGNDGDNRKQGAGITPACAGRRFPQAHTRAPVRDHPRVCGEKVQISIFSARLEGSPPRVRGEALECAVVLMVVRITPASAGRRPRAAHASNFSRDHPRVCGEKTKKIPNISRFYPGAACFSFSFS